ncbi:MAG: hypothetical protein ACRDRR_23585 [Pseudonocardiaceae bacterium]
MADFKIRKINAQVVQNADNVYNQGPILHQLQVTPGAKAQLQDLLADISALTQSGAVSHEIGHELRNSILTAADEADAPAPRWHRLTAALSHAKEIAVGFAAAAGIAESVDGVIKALGAGA